MIYLSKYGEIYYERHGHKGNPTVVLCHGVGMDSQTFAQQVAALKSEYQVIVWDLPGHGRSSMTKQDLRFTHMAAECLMGLLDETETDRTALVGISLGSFVIQHALARSPERVLATVHIGGLTLHPKYSPLLKPLFLMTGMLKIMPGKMFYRSFAKHRGNLPETKQYLENAIAKTGKDLVLKVTKDMGEDMLDGISELPLRPLLIMYGEDDIYTRKLSTKWHQRVPESQRAVISNANHIANMDNWEECNNALRSFLATL